MEIVILGKGVIFVRKIELSVKDIFHIGLEEFFLPVDSVVHGELIKLIEFNEGESESVESAFEGIFFPGLQFDAEDMFDKLEKIII